MTNKNTMEVKQYLGFDCNDSIERLLYKQEKLNRILNLLEEIKEDMDYLVAKTGSCEVTDGDIEALFEEHDDVDLSWIEEI